MRLYRGLSNNLFFYPDKQLKTDYKILTIVPHLNHTGPENEGPKTGRKLGKCHKTDDEQILAGELGKGLGKRRLSGGGKGKGNRLKYNQS